MDPVLDRKVIDEIDSIGGTPEFLNGLIIQFLAGLSSDLAALQDAASAGTIDVIRRTSHRMKGASGQMGAKALMAPCARLSHISDDDYAVIGASLLESLKVEAARAKDALEEFLAGRGGVK